MMKTRSSGKRGPRKTDSTRAFEKAAAESSRAKYRLKLYVTGSTPRSVTAIENIKRICEERLKGRYKLEIVDLYKNPEEAVRDHLVVAPTLVKRLPLPLRTFIGDLSQTEKILVGLDLAPKPERRAGTVEEP
jgi:circadian clock protein KaiB